jgi:hypothetical protein
MGRQLQVSWSDVYIWRESGCRMLVYSENIFMQRTIAYQWL